MNTKTKIIIPKKRNQCFPIIFTAKNDYTEMSVRYIKEETQVIQIACPMRMVLENLNIQDKSGICAHGYIVKNSIQETEFLQLLEKLQK